MTQPITKPPRLVAERSALLVVDVQDRLVPVMRDPKRLIRRAARLVQGAHLLGVPLLVTEQYPRGLGDTVDEIARHFVNPHCIEEKTRFSACIDPVRTQLELIEAEAVVVAGIEAHVCILGTCLDLLEAGYRVFPAWDAISSRRAEDKYAARERLSMAGAVPTTVESALMEWLADAGDSRFRAVQHLIKGDSRG
ncbi:MAG: isochorismatase family protein [Phycisphaeraceae bacterium]